MTSTVFVAVCAKIESGIVFAPATVPVNVGDVIDGDVPKTKLPVPVAPVEVTPSMVGCPAIVGDVSTTNFVPVPVCEVMEVALPEDVMTPVRLAFVVTFPAVNPDAVPVKFVATPEVGVPSAPE